MIIKHEALSPIFYSALSPQHSALVFTKTLNLKT